MDFGFKCVGIGYGFVDGFLKDIGWCIGIVIVVLCVIYV